MEQRVTERPFARTPWRTNRPRSSGTAKGPSPTRPVFGVSGSQGVSGSRDRPGLRVADCRVAGGITPFAVARGVVSAAWWVLVGAGLAVEGLLAVALIALMARGGWP
jgi:hypothetical protein